MYKVHNKIGRKNAYKRKLNNDNKKCALSQRHADVMMALRQRCATKY